MSVEMKDSGINGVGLIPDSWHTKNLGVFFTENSKVNYAFSSSNALQFKYGEIIQKANNNRELEEQEIELLKKYILVEPNDIVVNGLNLNYDFNSLRIARVKESGIITSAYIVLRPKFDGDTSFFNYLLKTLDNQKIFHGMGVGIRLTLKFKELRSMLIPIPPHDEEQSRIANFLDKKCAEIDELIALQEQMIAQLNTYKQAVITETVTKGLDPNVKMKDSGVEWIGEIPEHWDKDKIIRMFKTIGSGTTPKSTEDSNFHGTINWLQSGDINGNIISEAKHKISTEILKEYSVLKIYKAPFIIVAMYGASVGNISISDIDACVNQACCVMSNSKYDFRFLFYTIKSAKNYLMYRAVGGGQPNISQDTLKNLWLPNPPLSEQQSIAQYLDQKCKGIDDLISIKKEKIEHLKAYKKSVIYEYVTGKSKCNIL